MAFLRVVALLWADVFGDYILWLMQTYLTQVWELGFTHSAGITNLTDGLRDLLPLLLFFVVDVGFLTNKWMLLISSISNVLGCFFLFLSLPPILGIPIGTCGYYETRCIGDTQKLLLYLGLTFLAVGMSGHIVSLVDIFANQFLGNPRPPPVHQTDPNNGEDKLHCVIRFFRDNIMKLIRGTKRADPEPNEEAQPVDLASLRFQPTEAILELVKKSDVKVIRTYVLIHIPILATLFCIPYIKSWTAQFAVPGLCIFLATVGFAMTFCNWKEQKGTSDGEGNVNPITNVFKVLLAATLKSSKSLPTNDSQLHRKIGTSDVYTLPHTPRIRFLDKAAIKQGPTWLLCTVTQVEETKMLISMIPFWFTFVICGLVSSIGITYFIEQQNTMDYHIGKWKLPDSLFFIIQQILQLIMNRFAKLILSFFKKKVHHYSPAYGIAIATLSSTLCSIIAALMEKRRVNVIRTHIFDDIVPMSVFWLIPQYIFLAGLDSFYDKSVTPFLKDHSPPSMQRYLVFLSSGLSGLGIIGSVLSVYVVGIISETFGTMNWFQYYVNDSRLDMYYWTLAGMSAVSFFWFLCWAWWYPYWKLTSGGPSDEEAIDRNPNHSGRDGDEADMTELQAFFVG